MHYAMSPQRPDHSHTSLASFPALLQLRQCRVHSDIDLNTSPTHAHTHTHTHTHTLMHPSTHSCTRARAHTQTHTHTHTHTQSVLKSFSCATYWNGYSPSPLPPTHTPTIVTHSASHKFNLRALSLEEIILIKTSSVRVASQPVDAKAAV